MIRSLDHVILAVGNLEAARDDYRRVLGVAPSWSGDHPGWGTANVLFRLDNTYIELLSPHGPGPLGMFVRSWIDAHGDGAIGAAFGTDDIDGCRRELDERGMHPGDVEPGEGVDGTTGADRRWRRAALPLAPTRGVVMFPIQHDSPADALPMARADGNARAAVHALDHLVVQTADVAAARRLYGVGLGLRLAVDKEFPDWGVHLMFFRVGGITVEVAAALAGAAAAPPASGGDEAGAASPIVSGRGVDATTDRIYGLSYRVRSVEMARARLAAGGVDVSEVRTGRRPGTRVATVRSHTCGVPTLLIELDGDQQEAGR